MISILVDPNEVFPAATPESLIEACGLIPGWFLNWVNEKGSIESFKEVVEASYGFPCIPVSGTLQGSTFVSNFKEDAPLDPYLKLEIEKEEFFQYRYGIVAVRDKETGEVWIVRCS